MFALEQILRAGEEALRVLQAQRSGVDSSRRDEGAGASIVWFRVGGCSAVGPRGGGCLAGGPPVGGPFTVGPCVVCILGSEQILEPILGATASEGQCQCGSGEVDEFVCAEPVDHRRMRREGLRELGRCRLHGCRLRGRCLVGIGSTRSTAVQAAQQRPDITEDRVPELKGVAHVRHAADSTFRGDGGVRGELIRVAVCDGHRAPLPSAVAIIIDQVVLL